MPRITWDETGERFYETGVDHCVLYLFDTTTKKYSNGVAWNGITGITESPSGAEPTALYADNIKYLNLFSAEEFAATIEAFMWPDEFNKCDGLGELAEGIIVGQQNRAMFGLCYRTIVGNDVDGPAAGYKLHLIYGLTASPSEKSYATVNDSPEAITFSWEVSSVPVTVTDMKPTSVITIDSRTVTPEDMTKIEDALYGGTTGAELPLPDEILALLTPPAGP
jgi:hypothetical protein